VFGMVERGGDLMTYVVPNAKSKTLFPIIQKYVAPGSKISTDEAPGYRTLRKVGYKHSSVNHGREEWARGTTHTNTIEGFWSHFKCSMRGTHRSISRQHMQKYLVEFEFRFNLRGSTSSEMFDRLIQAF
jgi:transposase